MAKKSPENLQAAEPEARDQAAKRALQDRAAEIAQETPPGGGESPGQPGAAPVRDPAVDGAHLAALVEVLAHGAARLLAWKFPATSLFVGGTVLPRLPGFAAHTGGLFGPGVGLKFPSALPAVGGVCGLVVWGLRSLPPPKPPEEPSTEAANDDGAGKAGPQSPPPPAGL